MKFNNKIISTFAAGAILAFSAGAVLAEYPDQPIKMVVPYGPGGAADLSARVIAGSAPTYLGQPILTVNKTGAAGVVGPNFVVTYAAAGYTLSSARVGIQMGVPVMNTTNPSA